MATIEWDHIASDPDRNKPFEPRVPRSDFTTTTTEGGASAPPDAPTYEFYLARYHGALPPLSREEWTARDLSAVDDACTCPPAERPTHCPHKYALTACWEAALNPPETVPHDPIAPLSAADFCVEAARLVGGPRAATHGDKTINFANIAELWNGYWRIKCRVNDERLSTPFTAHDVGCMFELLKIARRFSGSFNADDYIDAAGYAGCTGEIAAKEAAHDSSL